MAIVGAFVLPHPPLAIPEVGKGQEQGISSTLEGYKKVARRIAQLAPETIVVISPHSVMYSDYIHISPGRRAVGNMGKFGASQVKIKKNYDFEFVQKLEKAAQDSGFPAGTMGEKDEHLDHGTLVPLYFVEQQYQDYKIIRCSISGLPFIDHYRFGKLIQQVSNDLGRRTVVLASGDLSHRLLEDGPYGFNPSGPVFDDRITKDIASGDFEDMMEFDQVMCEAAGECGHRSFIEMAGALDGVAVEPELLSHEGPFGVGYATAIIETVGLDDSRHFDEVYLEKEKAKVAEAEDSEDPYVSLARLSIRSYVEDGASLEGDSPEVREFLRNHPEVADGLSNQQAGAFVSIHEHGRLRGCIGTISATQRSLAGEIVQNAVSACSRDPRFAPIKPEDLDYLDVNVDVLGEAEPIDSAEELDVKKYGVIVTSGNKRGLLLPDIPGVESPEQQIRIALQKAGISERSRFTMERFEVVRHE